MFTKDEVMTAFGLNGDHIKLSEAFIKESDEISAISMFILSAMVIGKSEVEGNPKVTLDKTYKIDAKVEGVGESEFSGEYMLSETELLAKELFKHYQFKFDYENLTIELINP